jgi:energy-coupling factor transporter ATP-binding protein EcfA2
MIHRVQYRNFKGLQHVDLELEQLTVIVGPNASGKTSILDGLESLYGSLGPIWGGTQSSSLYYRSGKGDLELVASEAEGDYRIRMIPPVPIFEGQWTIKVEARKSRIPAVEWGPIQGLELEGRPSILLHLDAARLAAPSYSEIHPPEIDVNGDGLASVLAHMALNQPDDFQRLLESLREIIPSIRRVRFDREQVFEKKRRSVEVNGEKLYREFTYQVWGDSLLLDLHGGGSIPGSLASEGTMLVLGLLTVLMGPVRPKLFLLDDLERGLHPRAQEQLMVFLRRFLDQNPGTQIVATTHSPLLLNQVKAQEVRLTTLKADGAVACGRLDEHPEFDEWKDAMAPGEFWSLIGEGWLRESRTEERV